MAESPRPTRQQVDAESLIWDSLGAPELHQVDHDVLSVVAEAVTKAVGPELERLRAVDAAARKYVAGGLHDEFMAALGIQGYEADSALAARTPQPVEPIDLAGWSATVTLPLADGTPPAVVVPAGWVTIPDAARRPAEPLPWLTGAVPDETARVVADVKVEAVWLVLHMQANGSREDIQSALRTLRLVWGNPPPVEQPAAPQPAVPDGHHAPPTYLALDVWQALGLPVDQFDGYYERNGWAETWAVLMAAVRGPAQCERPVDGDVCVLAPHSESNPCYAASDVGSSEPLPFPPAVPDGEDAPSFCACTTECSGEDMSCPLARERAKSEGGEDVPARLEAAAGAADQFGAEHLAKVLWEASAELGNEDAVPELRAAVAAALSGGAR